METPVFEEIDPAGDCECPGCRHWRRVLPHAPAGRAPAHPAAYRTLVVATATAAASATAVSALGAGPAAALPAAAHAPHRPGAPAGDEPGTPQGPRAPLHGATGRPAVPPAGAELAGITRTEIVDRARTWVAAKVPYSMTAYWSDGYRQDCSGFVSMAWKLPANEWTGSLATVADRITKDELQPGDILLFHNAADPENGSHVVVFGGWTDGTRTAYTAYEQTPPHTRTRETPYAYWTNSGKYLPYRYKGVTQGQAGKAGTATAPPAAAGRRGPRLARGGGVPRPGHVPAGCRQRVRHPARQAAGEEGIRRVLHEGPGAALGRGGPARRPGLPARPGLARRGGGRPPGAGDLAAALLVTDGPQVITRS